MRITSWWESGICSSGKVILSRDLKEMRDEVIRYLRKEYSKQGEQ